MQEQLVQYIQATNPAVLGRDVLDLLITFLIFYRVALVLRGTRAMQVGVGLALVFVVYVGAEWLRLRTVLTLLSAILSSAILIGVVVFQNDIRRGLMRVGARARFGTAQNLEQRVIDAVVEAATTLARHRTGALITFERDASLDEFVGSHTGHRVDAAVSAELLVSLFIPEAMNRLHDGAVVLSDLRIAKAGVFFPMPEGKIVDESFGSRHRAAMGITEETDAVVVVVSEERGSISFCFNGNIASNLDGPKLRAALDGVFAPARRSPTRWWERRKPEPAVQKQPTPQAAPQELAVEKEAPESASVVPAPPSSEGMTPAPLRKPPQAVEEQGAIPEPLRRRSTSGSGELPAVKLPEPLRRRGDRSSRVSLDETGAVAEASGDKPPPLRKSASERRTEGEGGSRAARRPSEPPPSTRLPPTMPGVLSTPLHHLAPLPPGTTEPAEKEGAKEAVPMPRADLPESPASSGTPPEAGNGLENNG